MVAPSEPGDRASRESGKGTGKGFGSRIRQRLRGSNVYSASLKGPVPSGITFQPQTLWPEDPSLGAQIVDGTYHLAGQRVQTGGKVPWSVLGTSIAWQHALHSFSWLAAFQGSTDPDHRIYLQRLIGLWAEKFGAWDDVAWSADVLPCRIQHWIEAWPLISSTSNEPHNKAILRVLAEGSRHLARSAQTETHPADDIQAGVALVYAGVCLFDSERWIRDGLARLQSALNEVLLPDGCHGDRNPASLLKLVQSLLSLQHLLRDSGHSAPEFLQYAADRAVTALKCFRLGDGGLALFGGGNEGNPAQIGRAIDLNDSKSTPPMTLSHGGFHRLEAGDLVCVMDTGAEPTPPFDRTIHRGCLSFEMTDGPDRLIVNCGDREFTDQSWRAAMSSTAAHSTVVINNWSASVKASGDRDRSMVSARVRENDDWRAIEGHHDGYSAGTDIRHFRRLFLARDGKEVRGEDTLLGPRSARGIGMPFSARFHLHPDASASVLQDGKSVLIRLQHGTGWRFRAVGASPELTASIYFGMGDERRSQQIVLRGTITHETIVRWNLERL